MKAVLSLLAVLLLVASAIGASSDDFEPNPTKSTKPLNGSRVFDEDQYINANNILMFITSHGIVGRDQTGVFDKDFGGFYPYRTNADIESGLLDIPVVYAAGPWLGGTVNGEIRIAVAEYDSEYAPGPMSQIVSINGPDTVWTFDPDYATDPSYRVYKIYKDSLQTNPNTDYLEWPIEQGAPIDDHGRPWCPGDQTLWTVFNDADPSLHSNSSGETAPLGVEVQLTAYASDSEGQEQLLISPLMEAENTNIYGQGSATVRVVDPLVATGDDYRVVFEDHPTLGRVWHLENVTAGTIALQNQTDQSGTPVEVDGISIAVDAPCVTIESILEVSVFPPVNVNKSLNSTGDWYVGYLTEEDNCYLNWRWNMTTDNWEFRFTSGGSNYYSYYDDLLQPDRLPFEIWNLGSDIASPHDDQRVNLAFIDRDGNDIWSYGDRIYVTEVPYVEPAASALPWDWAIGSQLGRIVFQDSSGLTSAPAEGTHVRFQSVSDTLNSPVDTFYFSSPDYVELAVGGEGNIINFEYKLYNHGGNHIENMYFGFWVDPDLGSHTDDLTGCDSTLSLAYCYNYNQVDEKFGSQVPAIGFRVIRGPLVPSPGDYAVFGPELVPEHKNLPMTGFQMFLGGMDPNYYEETYNYLTGSDVFGDPYTYDGFPTSYPYSGDPLAGTGWLDVDAADRRMLLTSGPFDMAPGDSQYVKLQFIVGQGSNRDRGIVEVKRWSQSCCVMRGDFTHDYPPAVDISDIVAMVDFLFLGGDPAVCYLEADVNASGEYFPDISDVVYLVNFFFLGGPPPFPCE